MNVRASIVEAATRADQAWKMMLVNGVIDICMLFSFAPSCAIRLGRWKPFAENGASGPCLGGASKALL